MNNVQILICCIKAVESGRIAFDLHFKMLNSLYDSRQYSVDNSFDYLFRCLWKSLGEV